MFVLTAMVKSPEVGLEWKTQELHGLSKPTGAAALEGVPKKSSITSTNYFPLAIGGTKLGRKIGVLSGFLLEEGLLGFLVPTCEN